MRYLAADFGAGSGRIIVGNLNHKQLQLDEIHRFPNRQIRLHQHIYWDFLSLFEELKVGLHKAFAKYGNTIQSLGIDTWGVDYGLLDKNGNLISNPVCYRDHRTDGVMETAFQRISKEELFALASNQFLPINTVFQLFSDVLHNESLLKIADKLLFMPDLLNFFLTGIAANEYTIASTSQLLNSQTKQWETTIFERLQIPLHWMQPIVFPTTILGQLLPEIVSEVGGNLNVVAVGSHDTASAIAAINEIEEDSAFISSGTWSLMGVQVDQPIQTNAALQAGFTNEGTVFGKIRFLKNITGLWLLQSLLKDFQQQGETVDYESLINAAEKSSCSQIFDVEDARFTNPISMKKAINDYFIEQNKAPLTEKGDLVRSVCLSLATKYQQVRLELEHCTGKKIKTIHIVGGGTKNRLLNQLTAEITGCRIKIGAVEATAIGNILIQALTSNEISTSDKITFI
ncbi:MAG: rhamnulokinase [Bacteroidales bacterium]|nr:rhamnulokinase [Bacteroidales bacterium]